MRDRPIRIERTRPRLRCVEHAFTRSLDVTGLVSPREKEKRRNQDKRYPNIEPDDRKNRYSAYEEKDSDRKQDTPHNQINHPCGDAICIGHVLTSLLNNRAFELTL
jgi:hypothetical protein